MVKGRSNVSQASTGLQPRRMTTTVTSSVEPMATAVVARVSAMLLQGASPAACA